MIEAAPGAVPLPETVPPLRIERRSRPTPEALRQQLDPLAMMRLDLQRRARINLRSHLRRAVVRIGVLASFDLATFWLLRSGIRAVRDHGVLGAGLSEFFQTFLPKGYLSGLQFLGALLLSLAVTGSYGAGDRRRDSGRLLAGCALAVALPLWMSLWSSAAGVVVLQYLLTTLLVWGALVVNRRTVDHIVAAFRDPRKDAARTVFVGTADGCAEAVRSPAFAGSRDVNVVGWVEVGVFASSGSLGGVAQLATILTDQHVETVVLAGPIGEATFERVVEVSLMAGCHVMVLPGVEFPGFQPSVVWRGNRPLFELAQPSLRGWQFAVKRTFDIVAAVCGLLLLLPLFAVVAVLIKLDTPGPVFFGQTRIGVAGRRFRVWKFRTMRVGADAEKAQLAALNESGDPRLFKIKDDPRITRVGASLRRWSIDELPQLFNVVLGSMSLVGPRPFFESDLHSYEPHHFTRLAAKPGITGLWQVRGRSSITDFEEVVRLDHEYIQHWSFLLDLSLLFKTIPVVFQGRGAF